MKAIAAVDRNFGIGYRGDQLYIFPEDRKFFQKMTMGKTILVGRKTFACFPNGVALPGRRNVVLTRSRMISFPGCEVVHSTEEALRVLKKIPSEDIFVAGGANVYRSFLPYCEEAFLTVADSEYPADTYFPNLDEDPEWEMVWEGPEKIHKNISYRNRRYQRKTGGVSL